MFYERLKLKDVLAQCDLVERIATLTLENKTLMCAAIAEIVDYLLLSIKILSHGIDEN